MNSSGGESSKVESSVAKDDPLVLKKASAKQASKKLQLCGFCRKYRCRYRQRYKTDGVLGLWYTKTFTSDVCCLCRYLIIPFRQAFDGSADMGELSIDGMTPEYFHQQLKDATLCYSCLFKIRGKYPEVKVV